MLRVIEIFDTDSSETDFSLAGGLNGAPRDKILQSHTKSWLEVV